MIAKVSRWFTEVIIYPIVEGAWTILDIIATRASEVDWWR
jgi:hypothetical protein